MFSGSLTTKASHVHYLKSNEECPHDGSWTHVFEHLTEKSPSDISSAILGGGPERSILEIFVLERFFLQAEHSDAAL